MGRCTFSLTDQSINQSNVYNVNIPGEDRLNGTTAKSVINSKIEETGQDDVYGMRHIVLVTNPKHIHFNMSQHEPTGLMLMSSHIRSVA